MALGRTIGGGAIAAVCAGTLALAGCGNSATNTYNEVLLDGPPQGLTVGAPTTIGVRPDVLGAARDLPVSVTTDSVNGATVTVSGTLHNVQPDWIVIDDAVSGHRHWISLDTVSWIRQPRPRPAPAAGGGVTPIP